MIFFRKIFRKKNILFLILLLLLVLLIDANFSTVKFAYKRVMYSDKELINDTFNLKVTEQVRIDRLDIRNNSMFCTINVFNSDLATLFSNFKGSKVEDISRIPKVIRNNFNSNEDEFDYGIFRFEGARKGTIIFQSTTKEIYVLFSKPTIDTTKVYLYTNFLDWE